MFHCSAELSRTAAMEIGDVVIYLGKPHVLRGFEPMSVPNRRAELEDPESGEVVSVPVALLEEAPPDEGLGREP